MYLDTNFLQLSLLQKRKTEIDVEILTNQEKIKLWEDRISVFDDEDIRKVIDNRKTACLIQFRNQNH